MLGMSAWASAEAARAISLYLAGTIAASVPPAIQFKTEIPTAPQWTFVCMMISSACDLAVVADPGKLRRSRRLQGGGAFGRRNDAFEGRVKFAFDQERHTARREDLVEGGFGLLFECRDAGRVELQDDGDDLGDGVDLSEIARHGRDGADGIGEAGIVRFNGRQGGASDRVDGGEC